MTGHSGVTVARCLEVFVAQEEGQRYCSYCSGGHSGCGGACPCWGHDPGAREFRPAPAKESRLVRKARVRRRMRRKTGGSKAFGRGFSSDESGDGPFGKRRAGDPVEEEDGVAGLRAGVGLGVEMQVNTLRLWRLVRAGFLQRLVRAWRLFVVRQRDLIEITHRLEHSGVEFPIDSLEGFSTAIGLLRGPGLTWVPQTRWTWARLAQVFQTSQQTLRGVAAGAEGVGARSANRFLEIVNGQWQESMLAQQAMAEDSGSDWGLDVRIVD